MLACVWVEFGNGFAVLRYDDDLTRLGDLIHDGKAASLEFGSLNGLHGRYLWQEMYDHNHDYGQIKDQVMTISLLLPEIGFLDDSCRRN